MDFRQMRYIIETAECQSVSKAAYNLHISQSALSHYIRHAEDTLGAKLFDRSANPLALTYAGVIYVETAKRILKEHENMTRELRGITGHSKKLIRIGTSRDRASYMLPKILPEFRMKYPNVKIKVFTDSGENLRENLRKGRIDILFLPDDGKEIPANISTEIIYTEELMLASQKGFLKHIHEKFILPHEVDGLPFFMQFKAHTTRSFCDSWFRMNAITPDILMEFPSNITCFRMASSGLGLAIIPFMITRISNAEGETELYSLGEKPQTWKVLAYWRKDAYTGESEREMISIGRKIFSGDSLC